MPKRNPPDWYHCSDVYWADEADREVEKILADLIDELYGDDCPPMSPENVLKRAMRRWKGEDDA